MKRDCTTVLAFRYDTPLALSPEGYMLPMIRAIKSSLASSGHDTNVQSMHVRDNYPRNTFQVELYLDLTTPGIVPVKLYKRVVDWAVRTIMFKEPA